MNILKLYYSLIILLIITGQTKADEIHVAVASNFTDVIKILAARFEADTDHSITLISGSTGKHYAQIKNGAPFDAFFAADVERPKRLEAEGVAKPGSRFTYAMGKIVLWSPKADYVDETGQVLKQQTFHHLAIANPKLAPYGQAAQAVLQTQGLWASLQGRLVLGENIGQTFQFIKSGNAELGFVAYAQVKRLGHGGSLWMVPQSLYAPIEQQAVLLKENEVAQAFLSFVKNDTARKIIHKFGYDTP
jgi:molybdate transport system substrate-binding protein